LPFLYLTTRGWKTGRSHEIEIWYVGLGGSYYLVAEMRERSHWVQNIQREANVRFIVSEKKFEGKARIVDPKNEPELAGRVRRSMDEEYNWSNGTIVELRPSDG
jgi:deazaflavin-dependent oxidoreductase (nitroreductase family)